MAIKLKCKIKSMRIEKVGTKKNNEYVVEIIGTDKAMICNEQYCMALNSNQIVKIVETPIEASTNSEIFNFISAHSRDSFIMELEKDTKVYFIKSAEVTYG